MSTAAVSGQSIFQELQSFYQNRQVDLKQLGSALQSGDLNGAQQAYNALATLGQSGPFADSEPFSKSTRAQAFETIGQDLQAGDLDGAQAAFATLASKQNASSTSAQAAPSAVINVNSNYTPAIGSTPSIFEQLQAYRQQRQADLTQLGQDMQAGNQSAAQQDFNTLTALGQSGPNKNGQPFQNADRAQDFQAIGQALQSGNLSLAQSAYASLASSFGGQNQQVISAYGSGTIGPVPAWPSAQLPSSTVALPPATGTTSTGSGVPEIIIDLNSDLNLGGASSTGASRGSTTPELVINLQENGSSSASPEKVTINLDSGSSGTTVSISAVHGNSTEQLTINLNQQSNNELILNLLNSNATSQTQSNSGNVLSVSA
jgi:hypothetical protein